MENMILGSLSFTFPYSTSGVVYFCKRLTCRTVSGNVAMRCISSARIRATLLLVDIGEGRLISSFLRVSCCLS